MSSVNSSVAPAAPVTEIESVLVVVAPAQSTGTAPNCRSPSAATLRVASPPGSRSAVTALVVALYEQASTGAAPMERSDALGFGSRPGS